MTSFVIYILTSLAMVLVIEGLIYALFTDAVRKMMATALTLPERQLRTIGTFMAVTGFVLAWILGRFHPH